MKNLIKIIVILFSLQSYGQTFDTLTVAGSREYLGQKNKALLEIEFATNNSSLLIKKPLIIVEGFDSGLQGIENEFGESDLSSFFLESDLNSGLNLPEQLDTYDIIYINFLKGSDDLHRNAYLVEDVIKWVNAEKTAAGSSIPNVVLGQSMGGVLARFALRDMENQYTETGDATWQHQTSLYVSHDAPHQGANIPLSILAFARHMIDQFVSTPLGDFNINITGEGAPVTIEDMQTLLNATGTKQLLINNLEGTFYINNTVGDAWRTELRNLGYPQLTRNISLSNGSHCAFTQPFAPLDNLFTLTGGGQTALLTDLIMFFTPIGLYSSIGLAVLFNEPGLLIGMLPGNSKFNLNFYGKALPTTGGTNRIYNGTISFTKTLFKLFGWTPRITVNITNKGYDAPAIPSYDYFPGGAYNSFLTAGGTTSNPDFAFLGTYGINLITRPSFNFIPTTSALDIGNGSVALSDTDYLKKYAANIPLIAPKTTPFSNYTTSYNNNGINEQHISFNTRNGDWLATELDADLTNNEVFTCLNFCANSAITGSKFLCTTGNYSVTSEATTVIWSITSGNSLVTLSNATSTTATLTQTSPNSNGNVTLAVTYGNERCGFANAILTIWVGKPRVTNFSIIGASDNVPANSSDQFNVNYATEAVSYDWTVSSLSSTCTDSNGFYPPGIVLPKFSNGSASYSSVTPYSTISWGNCSGTYLVNCKAVNTCGFTAYYTRIVNVYGPGGGGGGGEDPCLPSLQVYPNPVKDDDLVVNLIPPPDPCGGIPSRIAHNGKNILNIYDMLGNLVYTKTYNSLEIRINDLNLKRGHYILNVFTSSGKTNKEIIIVE